MEFSMPMRIRWDVDFRGGAGRAKRIARRIREAGPLLIEPRIEGKKGISLLPAILSEFLACNPRIVATVDWFPGAGKIAERGYPMEFVWGIRSGESIPEGIPEGSAAISFIPDEETFPELPRILDEFSRSGLAELHLPNVNAVRAVAEKGHVPVPSPSRMPEAAERIRGLGLSMTGKRLLVHDFFLWKFLKECFPEEVGGRTEFSGCQAGSGLAHVDWEGNVYPCDALPLRLGNILESPLSEIWGSPARERIFEAIRSIPAACGSCDGRKECISGCRGLAYVAAGTLDAPDPSCPKKR